MNKMVKGFIMGVAASCIVVPAFSFAETFQGFFNSVNISLNSATVAQSGESYILDDGAIVPYSINYKGTVYLPVRKMSDLLGVGIDYNKTSQTINITNGNATNTTNSTTNKNQSNTSSSSNKIDEDDLLGVVLDATRKSSRYEITMLVDGKEKTYDALSKVYDTVKSSTAKERLYHFTFDKDDNIDSAKTSSFYDAYVRVDAPELDYSSYNVTIKNKSSRDSSFEGMSRKDKLKLDKNVVIYVWNSSKDVYKVGSTSDLRKIDTDDITRAEFFDVYGDDEVFDIVLLNERGSSSSSSSSSSSRDPALTSKRLYGVIVEWAKNNSDAGAELDVLVDGKKVNYDATSKAYKSASDSSVNTKLCEFTLDEDRNIGAITTKGFYDACIEISSPEITYKDYRVDIDVDKSGKVSYEDIVKTDRIELDSDTVVYFYDDDDDTFEKGSLSDLRSLKSRNDVEFYDVYGSDEIFDIIIIR